MEQYTFQTKISNLPRIVTSPNHEIYIFRPLLFEPFKSMIDQSKRTIAIAAISSASQIHTSISQCVRALDYLVGVPNLPAFSGSLLDGR